VADQTNFVALNNQRKISFLPSRSGRFESILKQVVTVAPSTFLPFMVLGQFPDES
jgi:hypothetical protein